MKKVNKKIKRKLRNRKKLKNVNVNRYRVSVSKSLNNSLNNTLQVYHGDTSEIIDEILKENDFSEISWNKMYDDKSKKIEEKVKNIAKKHQLKSYIYNSSLLLEPSKTLKKDGTPYKVFTPFYRQNFLFHHWSFLMRFQSVIQEIFLAHF